MVVLQGRNEPINHKSHKQFLLRVDQQFMVDNVVVDSQHVARYKPGTWQVLFSSPETSLQHLFGAVVNMDSTSMSASLETLGS